MSEPSDTSGPWPAAPDVEAGPVRPLCFESLTVRTIRNLTAVELQPARRLNVIAGDNGHGKTSLLEALYLVATTRSFRTERNAEIVQQGAPLGTVTARVLDGALTREQHVGLASGRRSLLLDGKRETRIASFALRTPVVVFHPGDLGLASGGATTRRLLLDRLLLHLREGAADDRSRYLTAMRDRQRILADRGPRAADLDAYEELMAEHGVRFCAARRLVTEALREALLPAYGRMATADAELTVHYEPGGTEQRDLFRRELGLRRGADLRRGAASFGPQRDELELSLNGRSVRRHGSQGQQRLVSLALKLAELGCIRQARRTHPVLLLDDVSSELDSARTDATLALLAETRSQVFITTTRPELLPASELGPEDKSSWKMLRGELRTG